MCTVRAKVMISGGEQIGIRHQEYFFTGEPKEAFLKASSYAQGYAFACREGKYKLDLRVQDLVWWLQGSDFKIEVMNMQNKNIKYYEEL